MPIIQENTGLKTQYFKLKSFEFTKNIYNGGITVKEPAFIIWNGEKEIMTGQTFEGNLYNINLGDEKEIITKQGLKIKLMEIFLEFRGWNEHKELVKEVVVLTYPSTLFEKLIQKLAAAKTFRKLKIKVGQYIIKNTDKKRDYVSIFEEKRKLPNIINFKSKSSEFPNPEGLIEIPEIQYLEFEDGTKEVHKNWKIKLKNIYWEQFQKIVVKLEEYKESNYQNEFESDENEHKEIQQEEVYLVDDHDLPNAIEMVNNTF